MMFNHTRHIAHELIRLPIDYRIAGKNAPLRRRGGLIFADGQLVHLWSCKPPCHELG